MSTKQKVKATDDRGSLDLTKQIDELKQLQVF